MSEQAGRRAKVRALAGAFLGIGSALSLNSYILSTFAPYFLKEFHWTQEQWTWLSVAALAILGGALILGATGAKAWVDARVPRLAG